SHLFPRPHKQARARSAVLHIEPLEVRLVPAVLSAQQQQLASYWADKLADIHAPATLQVPTVPLTTVSNNAGSTGDTGTPLTGEKKYEMPAAAKFDPLPLNYAQSLVKDVLTYATDLDNNTIPIKRLKITNNANVTIYPVLRDGNEAETEKDSNVGLYDP